MNWRIFHKDVTESTNLDAMSGVPGDVFTADFQTAGRGRLDHKWLSDPGDNLMMSAVLDVEGLSPDRVATITLAVGLAVLEGLSPFTPVDGCQSSVEGASETCNLQPTTGKLPNGLALKWPNDIYWNGRKLCGILCQRNGDKVIAGIGINIKQRKFAAEIANTAISLVEIMGTVPINRQPATDSRQLIPSVRDSVLNSLTRVLGEWRLGGLSPLRSRIAAVDFLKGRMISVWQTDDDAEPISGRCDGIAEDGSLIVANRRIYAGEAHVGFCPHCVSSHRYYANLTYLV